MSDEKQPPSGSVPVWGELVAGCLFLSGDVWILWKAFVQGNPQLLPGTYWFFFIVWLALAYISFKRYSAGKAGNAR